MSQQAEPFHLSDDDVAVVLKAIQDGHVLSLEEESYDPTVWDEEAVRDWLEHAQTPMRSRQIVDTLKGARNIYSRPMSPTVEIALNALISRIERLERELAELKAERG